MEQEISATNNLIFIRNQNILYKLIQNLTLCKTSTLILGKSVMIIYSKSLRVNIFERYSLFDLYLRKMLKLLKLRNSTFSMPNESQVIFLQYFEFRPR